MIPKFQKVITILLSAFFLVFSLSAPSLANQTTNDSSPFIIESVFQSGDNINDQVLRLEGSKTVFDLGIDDEGNFFIKTETKFGDKKEDPKGMTVSSSADLDIQSIMDQEFETLPEDQLQQRSLTPKYAELTELASSESVAVEDEPGYSYAPSDEEDVEAPEAFGTSGIPYTGSRVLGGTTNPAQAYPYRRAGKLYMAIGGNTYNYICSASMIGRSLLITAAHCVHDYGKKGNGWARKVKFVPAKNSTSEPYTFFESSQYLIPTSYYNGTDTCTTRGVVCNNDIALVALRNNSRGQQAGNLTGWFGYGWNGYSYAIPSSNFQGVFGNKRFASITQLGYPGSLDSGQRMQINTAYGALKASGNLRNTWLGSNMTGGSSGGPWLVNFGITPSGTQYGSATVRNVVVGVTSWGYTDRRIQMQGASWFGQNREFPNGSYGSRGAGNIGKLVYDACDNPAFSGWKLQSRGRCR